MIFIVKQKTLSRFLQELGL